MGIVHLVEAASALLFAIVALRVALLLGATPVGAMRQEILYLRTRIFRPLMRLVVLLLLLEAAQLALPWLSDVGALQGGWLVTLDLGVDLAQAVLLVVIALGTLQAFRPYSRRGLAELEVVARRSMESLQRRLPRPRPPVAGTRRGP